jgi:hypothetical protein
MHASRIGNKEIVSLLLMNTNINWLKSNRQYLSNRQIIKFKSELKKKFKKKN